MAATTRRRPAAAGPIPGRSVPPARCWGASSAGHLPANRRPAVPTREQQSGGPPTHAAPARHADPRARPPPANRPSVDHHKHHGRDAQVSASTLTAVPTSERLLDRTVLEPTHPELGTCWQFTGTATPYGRIAKAQDSYTHRLGWKLLRGDNSKRKGFTTDVASTHAGIQTIWSSSPTPRINGTCARRTASTAIRCRVTICGSARMACEPAGRAMRLTSGRSGSAMTAEGPSVRSP